MKKQKETESEDRAESQAKAQFESIMEMVNNLKAAQESGNGLDEAESRIQEDPLSVEIRSDWHTPGTPEKEKLFEFSILLCTGGPAVRIIGDLDVHMQPDTCHIEYQDWFTSWTEYRPAYNNADVLTYCRQFWYGE